MTDMELVLKSTESYSKIVVNWDWLEEFAKDKNYDIAKEFFAEAKEAWTDEMKKRMKTGLFYGN